MSAVEATNTSAVEATNTSENTPTPAPSESGDTTPNLIQQNPYWLSKEVVKSAWQLYSFLEATGDTHLGDVPHEIGLTIEYICYKYPRPEPQPTKGKGRASKRSSAEPLQFPANWATDTPTFRRNVRSFSDRTVEYRKLPKLQTYFNNNAQHFPNDQTNNSSDRPITSTENNMASSSAAGAGTAASQDQNYQNTGFSQQQWTALQNLIRNAATPGPQGPPGRQGQQGERGQPGFDGLDAAATAASKSRWNASEIGFFHPMYEDKSIASGAAPMEHTPKDTYFRDVHLFIEHARDVAGIKGDELVRTNLWTCLKGPALEWWLSELGETEKRLAKLGNKLDEWERILVDRFRAPSNVAIESLLRERYTLRDASNRREPREYAQKILRTSKDAGLTNVRNQLDMIYNGLDADLRRDIRRPRDNTSLNDFLEDLDDYKHDWWTYAHRHGQRFAPQQTSQNRQNRPGDSGRNNGQYQPQNRPPQQQLQQQPRSGQSFPNGYQYQQPRQSSNQNAQQNVQFSRPFNGQNTAFQRPFNAQNNQTFQGFSRPNAYSNPQQNAQQSRQPLQLGAPNVSNVGSNRAQFGTQFGNQQMQQYPPRNQGFQGFQGQNLSQRPYVNQQQQRPRAAAYQGSTEELQEPDNEKDGTVDSNFHSDFQEENAEQESTYFPEESWEESEHNYSNFGDEQFAGFVGIETYCRCCEEPFSSKNKLHKHLKSGCEGKSKSRELSKNSTKSSANPDHSLSKIPDNSSQELPGNSSRTCCAGSSGNDVSRPPKIVNSQASGAELGNGFAFRSWTYAMIPAKLDPEKIEEDVCADTGCGVSLIDREWRTQQAPETAISKMATPLRVRGVGSSHHETSEFVTQHIYLPAIDDQGNPILACFYRELHIVDNLRAKMLIGNDIIGPEGIVIDIANKQARIGSCNATASITAKPRGEFVRRKVYVKESTFVAPGMEMMLPTKPINLPIDRDFIFEPVKQAHLTMFAHIVDHKMSAILVRNESNKPVQIPRKFRLGNVQEMDFEHCFLTEMDHTAIVKDSGSMTTELASNQSFNEQLMPLATEENRLSNGVMVYGRNAEETQSLADLVYEFPDIWIDTGFVKVPEEEWMKHRLRDDWQTRISGKAKVYPLGIRDREVIDKVFNELHEQGRLEWTKESTPFSFPVFVVWKTLVDGKPKGRPVVDVRRFNELLVRDAYPVPLQQDVIDMLTGCLYISVMDATSFFYQWRVHPTYRHMQTVVTHRGQETFNVPIMGNMNSIAYVQRQIDRILRRLPGRNAKAYVDDIVTGARTFYEHLRDLRLLFELFMEFNITVSPTKTFLGYPDVNLLGRKVNSFGLISPEDKLKAISQLKYPSTLGDLEHYLGLTGYLRQYVHFYAQLARELQDLKTEMLKESPRSGRQRKVFSSTKRLPPPSEKQIASYQMLQESLSRPSILVHFDSKRTLWIDLDASKEFGFGAMVFHVKTDGKRDANKSKWPSRAEAEPIMFLSRLLTSAERNYWPTELEIAGIVWTLKKVRHMVESSHQAVRIQTDHSAIIDIMRQNSIVSTSSTMRMNTRLIRASQFLKQFNLDISYKPGKEHIVPDALSRLASLNKHELPDHHSELDSLTGEVLFTAALVQMDESFHNKVLDGYSKDDFWARTLKQVKDNSELGENAASLSFCLGKDLPTADDDPYFSPRPESEDPTDPSARPPASPPIAEGSARGIDNLLFHVDKFTGHQRLCIPQSLVKEVLTIAHGSGHPGFSRCHQIVSSSWYIHGLNKQLREFIRHCPECLVLQTRRHAPYGNLQPISTVPVPFHTLTLDFILALPVSVSGMDSIMSATCKYTKGIQLIPGKSTWSAAEWGKALLNRLDIVGWGLPKATITDRDRKFLSEMWRAIFELLKVSLLYSTAYHPQTDGSSERTNQTAEIALRYFVHGLEKPNMWPETIPRIQGFLNSSGSPSANEIAFGFTPNRPLDLLSNNQKIDHFLARISAKEAIDLAQVSNKFHYDRKHQPMFLRVGDWALLRLHKGYKIPSTLGVTKKLTQQYVGPFQVLQRVGRLAYKLDIPDSWLVHPVFTIAQLEPCPDPNKDPFERPNKHIHIPPVSTNEDGSINCEIERLLNKRVHKKGRGYTTEYLIRWKSYGPEYDQWYNVKSLGDAGDLVQEYEQEVNRIRSTTPWFDTTTSIPDAVSTPNTGTNDAPIPPKRRPGRPRLQRK